MTTPTNDRREVLAAVIRSVTDLWDEPLDEVHDIPPIINAVIAALAAQEGERGGAEVAAVEAERWEEGHSQGVIDYMNRHEPDLPPSERLLRAVMLVDAWADNPYRTDRIEAQP